MYNFETAKTQWQRIPFDNVGYVDSEKILAMSKSEVKDFISTFEENRYSLSGWRNHENKWRGFLGLDSITGKRVLDFGCGFGIDSLQFAKASMNQVILADINESNLKAAERVFQVAGYKPLDTILVSGEYPFFSCEPFDVFYSSGVLHHTPKIGEILQRASELCEEVRLMLYSDKAWEVMIGTPPVRGINIVDDPNFGKFVRRMDGTGTYADWFDREKLEGVVNGSFDINHFDYICGGETKGGRAVNDIYCVAQLLRRNP